MENKKNHKAIVWKDNLMFDWCRTHSLSFKLHHTRLQTNSVHSYIEISNCIKHIHYNTNERHIIKRIHYSKVNQATTPLPNWDSSVLINTTNSNDVIMHTVKYIKCIQIDRPPRWSAKENSLFRRTCLRIIISWTWHTP